MVNLSEIGKRKEAELVVAINTNGIPQSVPRMSKPSENKDESTKFIKSKESVRPTSVSDVHQTVKKKVGKREL